MSYFFLVIFVLLSSTSGSPIYKSDERTEEFSPKEVVDFNVDISEAGQEYIERIEVDPDKQTELFQVPAHPGVDRSDVLNDFKQHLTLLRFPDSKICYLFPLVNQQSTPEELIRDLEMAKQMVITETRRVDTTWLVDGEMTDRSVLSDELADFCAKYPIYHVKETRGSLRVTGMETEERTNRRRRQTGSAPNATALCPGAMDRNTTQQNCSTEPEKICKTISSCVKSVKCIDYRYRAQVYSGWPAWMHSFPPSFWRSRFSKRSIRIPKPTKKQKKQFCRNVHGYQQIVCCEYICNSGDNIGNPTTSSAEILERRLL
ncbi:ATP-binding cassette sub- F member 3 [Desmophyllum pertusum]|uniref:Integral membrane protein 2 n=1 Tax=Desmophyllum pertusum TaxID=174260 RepID=A0A9X0CIL0_9CNID|nr:ATP-binding cassette sub- F member 3 [Desmophyllum pertusum]